MAEESDEKNTNWIGFCRQHQLFYYVPAIVLGGLIVVAAFSDEADAWPLLVLFGICILAPNIDKLQSIQVTASGVMANMKKATTDAHLVTDEAKYLMETLRQATVDTTAVSLELVQRSGWVGGFDEDVKAAIRQAAMKTLRETGVADEEIDGIMQRRWYRYDYYTYASHILGHSTIPDFGSPAPFNQEDPEATEMAKQYRARIHAEWSALGDRWEDGAALPDELEAFIEKTGDDDIERQGLLAAYRYYCEHKTHQDVDLWERKSTIPPINIKRIAEDQD